VSWLTRRPTQWRQGKGAPTAVERERAFMDCVFVHWESGYRYALRLTGNASDAADLMQDTLTKAFAAFDKTRDDTQWRPWLFTIIRNGFISKVRRSSRERFLDDPAYQHLEPSVGSDDDAPVEIDWRTLRGAENAFEDELLLALMDLPEAQRSALVLCDIEGCDYETIAAVLDCPVGTVRSRIHHARRRLRVALATYAIEKGYRHAERA